MATETMQPGADQRGAIEKFLKKSCPQGEITKDNEGNFTGFRNFLQMVLASRAYGDTPDHSTEHMWLAENSAAFAAAFDAIIEKDPFFFDGHATLREIPEEKWAQIEGEIEKQKSLLANAK